VAWVTLTYWRSLFTADGFALVDAERPITIRHLLTHTSGIGYGLDTATPLEAAYARAPS
jgi:CubicO group peptidase (beta-lactamase class C family)